MEYDRGCNGVSTDALHHGKPFFSFQVSLKIEEKEIEHALKGKAFIGNILAAGLP